MRLILAIFLTWVCGQGVAHAVDKAHDFEAILRTFSAARYELAKDLSKKLNLTFPPRVESFFNTAMTGNWESVSNEFDRLKGEAAYGPSDPALQNELWATIHETIGIWEVWAGWKMDSTLLAMFHEPVLMSMPAGSVYFGGTDYGRFVITTVNAVQEPPPVICVTQNALADNTYMDHLRAVYGDSIRLPSPDECTAAFEEYVEDVRSGKREAGHIKFKGGRVSVSGVKAVMEINAIIARKLFEQNKDLCPFFVEESYVIDWMYPYLEPHGLIMKLNSEPLDVLPERSISRDRKLWTSYENKLMQETGFTNNIEARKAFAKLRSAIAGLYVFRKMYDEATAAFEQAIRLYPESPEANQRLADLYVAQDKTEEAIVVLESYLAQDPALSRDEAERRLAELKNKASQHRLNNDSPESPIPALRVRPVPDL